ncbi:hypothetical protein N7486_001103 [Penicillium sp. IBT 16267x]|nr:hypothetical protein N7486_001103 [Penicillium sp. IBT 16267x]
MCLLSNPKPPATDLATFYIHNNEVTRNVFARPSAHSVAVLPIFDWLSPSWRNDSLRAVPLRDSVGRGLSAGTTAKTEYTYGRNGHKPWHGQ